MHSECDAPMVERNERLGFSMDDGNPFRRLREVCGFTGANGPHFPGSSAYPVCFARTRADSLSAYRAKTSQLTSNLVCLGKLLLNARQALRPALLAPRLANVENSRMYNFPMPSLDGVRLKLARAEEHLRAVQQIVSTMSRISCEIVPEEDTENPNSGVLRVRLSKPPESLGPIIGDFLFNVRSALDHLVWQLILANDAKPDKSNMFPICATTSAFADECKRGRLTGVAIKEQEIIEALQPYHCGNEILLTLAELHNTDKHRDFNLVTAVASDTTVEWSDSGGPFLGMHLGDEELRDGKPFGGIAMPFTSVSMRERFFQARSKGYAQAFIAFDYPDADELEPFRVDSVLHGILCFVKDLIFPMFCLRQQPS
jgi:hypothetical protein